MYQKHAKEIQTMAQQSADHFVNTILVVALSIQQGWDQVGNMVEDININGDKSKFLWGFKINTYRYLQSHKHFLFGQFMAVMNSTKSNHDKSISLMKIFLQIDGLGLAKAGFCCQLTAGLVGCIDVHNIKIYDIKTNDLTLSKKVKSQSLKLKKIDKYITICHNIGTENLWNTWCTYLSTKNKFWKDADHVSQVHVDYVKAFK